jgi:hypothetical protein
VGSRLPISYRHRLWIISFTMTTDGCPGQLAAPSECHLKIPIAAVASVLRWLFWFLGEALQRGLQSSVRILVSHEIVRHDWRIGDIADGTGVAGATFTLVGPGQPRMVLADEASAFADRAGFRIEHHQTRDERTLGFVPASPFAAFISFSRSLPYAAINCRAWSGVTPVCRVRYSIS